MVTKTDVRSPIIHRGDAEGAEDKGTLRREDAKKTFLG